MIQGTQEPIVETVDVDGTVESSRAVRTETWAPEMGQRPLPQSVLDRIDAIEPRAAESDASDDEPTADEAADPPAPEASTGEPPAEVKPESAVLPDPRAEIERLTAANAKLVADYEAATGKQPEIPEPLTKLSAAAESYVDDEHAALRSFIAHSIGVDDPSHKDVDAELEYLYTSLTAKSLGVTPDPAHLAQRDHARTRQLLARQKRERQHEGAASEAKAKAEAETKATHTAKEIISSRLQSASSDYPLTMALAQEIDGLTPHELVLRTIQRESKAGRFDNDTLADDAKLIAAAAKIIESRYQSIITKTQSTVTPSAKQAPAANGATAKSATAPKAPEKSTRTLTNADASVAPATPAKKSAVAEKPKFKTDAERRDWALRRLPK